MYIKTVVLLLCLTLIVLMVNNTFRQQQLQKQPDELSQVVQTLQQQVKQLEQRLSQRGDAVLAVAQQQVQTATQQSELLQQGLTASQLQSQAIDQQINTLDAVVEDLAMQQMQHKQLKDVQASLRQEALHAANRLAGLSIASNMKMAVVEFYHQTGQFPSSNTQVGYPNPTAFADDNIQTISLSDGGRITVVYTARSGVEGGAISLTPKYQLGMFQWRCSTADFETIKQFVPGCELADQ